MTRPPTSDASIKNRSMGLHSGPPLNCSSDNPPSCTADPSFDMTEVASDSNVTHTQTHFHPYDPNARKEKRSRTHAEKQTTAPISDNLASQGHPQAEEGEIERSKAMHQFKVRTHDTGLVAKND